MKRGVSFLLIILLTVTPLVKSISIEAFEPIDSGKIFPMTSSAVNTFRGDLRDVFFIQRAFLGNISALSSLYNSIIAQQSSPEIFLQSHCDPNANELVNLILASEITSYYNIPSPNQWSSTDALAIVKLNPSDIPTPIPNGYIFHCIDKYTVNYGTNVVADPAQFALIPISLYPVSNSPGVDLQIGLSLNSTKAFITAIAPTAAAISKIEVFQLPSPYQAPIKIFNTSCATRSCDSINITIQPNSLYEFLACNNQSICDVRMIPT